MPGLRIGLQATAVYVAVLSLGMTYFYRVRAAPYGTTEMVSHFWLVELILCAVVLYYALRYFGWAQVGFGPLNRRAVIWVLPAYAAVAILFWVLAPTLVDGRLTAADWSLLGWIALTTFMVGFSEEVMFRGILLRAAMARMPVAWAMLLSAVLFAAMHSVNMLAGLPVEDMVLQVAFTFLVGFFLAPLALKIGNLWPLIIWHWLWDLALFSGPVLGVFQPFAFVGLLFQVVISLWLWRAVMREG